MIRRSRERSAPDWRSVLAPVDDGRPYEEQLDALLDAVRRATGLPLVHLYLADPDGQRFHLERATLSASHASDNEGGAESMTSSPPSELLRGGDDRSSRVVATPMGRFWGVPLGVAESISGLVLVGPVGDAPPPDAGDAIDALRWPLSLAVDVARDREHLRRQLAAATSELQASRDLQSSALEIDRFVGLLLELARSATRADGGFVAVVDDTGRLTVRASTGLTESALARLDLAPETGMFDWAAADLGGALILRDLEAAIDLGWSSVLAVPVQDDQRALGIIALVSLGSGIGFDTDGLDLLSTYADQARLMLGNARLFSSFVTEYLATVQGLALSLDARRPHTRGRHAVVAASAALLAEGLGLAPDVVDAIRIAGTVHDVGMAALQDDDLAAGDLDHPSVSAGLVEHLPLHPEVVRAIRAHHEWYDGWGFPDGLRGQGIPIGGRVLAVAVLLAELAAGDPVRPPATIEQLADALEVRRGSQLDPDVVDVALRLLPDLPLRPTQEA
ncbi:MAG TPA: HD domain-containing phosphohydrolase [Acidimicrobiales bacterium]|nr:HD domain-containing phosphohydrolase [Acidimicrobiales bacterium]